MLALKTGNASTLGYASPQLTRHLMTETTGSAGVNNKGVAE
jgi:hypothetical protein